MAEENTVKYKSLYAYNSEMCLKFPASFTILSWDLSAMVYLCEWKHFVSNLYSKWEVKIRVSSKLEFEINFDRMLTTIMDHCAKIKYREKRK